MTILDRIILWLWPATAEPSGLEKLLLDGQARLKPVAKAPAVQPPGRPAYLDARVNALKFPDRAAGPTKPAVFR